MDELRARCNIVEVISGYVSGVEKKGRTHFACCPFHHEKTPSFAINEREQFYHCFGCGKSGNAITFVEEIENVGFPEAVEILAKRFNMPLPDTDEGEAARYAEQKKVKDRLREILKSAALFYHGNLKKSGVALEYLRARGVADNIAVRFGLGYSADFDSLTAHLKAEGYGDGELLASGALQASSRDGKLIDAMAMRLVFPIVDSLDDVIGFSGRILEKRDNIAKYKNTNATVLFDKSRSLYGINLLKKEKRKNGIEDAILVEGHMDLVSLSSAGIKNSVASMGTALTNKQAALIKRYADKVYIAYDGDKAGQNAAMRGLAILEGEGLDVKVIELPDGRDPDDIIKNNGKEFFLSLKDKALPLYEYRIRSLSRGYDLNSPDDRGKFARAAVSAIRGLNNKVLAESYLDLISAMSKISVDTLRGELELRPVADTTGYDAQNNYTPLLEIKEQAAAGAEFDAARFVLNALINKNRTEENIAACLTNSTHVEIMNRIMSGDFTVSALYDEIEDKDELDAIVAVDKAKLTMTDEEYDRYFCDSVDSLRQRRGKADSGRLVLEYNSKTDDAEKKEVLECLKKRFQEKNKPKNTKTQKKEN